MQTTWQSAQLGARSTGGFFISTFIFGMMFGLAGSAAGIEPWQGLLMSGLVFSASAQFAALEFWQSPVPWSAIALSVVLVSSRNILLGLSAAEHFDGHSLGRRFRWLFLLNDPGVVTMFSREAAVDRLGYVTGYGAALWVSWMTSTALGYAVAGVVDGELAAAFGFAGPLVMATMLILFIKGSRARHLPWVVTGVTALAMTEAGMERYLILPGAVTVGVIAGLIQNQLRPATSASS